MINGWDKETSSADSIITCKGRDFYAFVKIWNDYKYVVSVDVEGWIVYLCRTENKHEITIHFKKN